MQRTAQNSLVIVAALAAALLVVQTQTGWLENAANKQVERERCFGITRAAGNDCATPRHSCAAQSKTARDDEEWIMVPKGLCDKIAGGRAESL